MGSRFLIVCLASVYLSDGATLGEGQMGMTELIQMKTDLEDRLKSGVKINETETDTWVLFKALFENTTIEYIKSEFSDIGGQLNTSYAKVTTCHSTLATHKTSWDTQSDDKNTKFKTHDDCRTNQPDQDCNKTCTRCKAWVEGLFDAGGAPTDSIKKTDGGHRVPVFSNCDSHPCWGEFGDDLQNTTISEWFEKYHDWHCVPDDTCPDGESGELDLKRHDCWVNCTHRCAAEVIEWDNNVTTCNDDQDDFEDALCLLYTTVTDNCNTYTTCRLGNGESDDGADQEYRDEKIRVQDLETTLQAEYQMVKSIICLIDLLLTDEDTVVILDSNISDCGDYYETPCPALAICIPEDAGWDTAVNCECTNFPNADSCDCSDGTNPGWCDATGCETNILSQHNECSYKDIMPNLLNCTAFETVYYHGRPWWEDTADHCDSDDVLTEVTVQVCSSDRASARGCSA